VIGSTGTGKSQLGVEIAEYISSTSSTSSSEKYTSASVISADSMQIYHGLDVITNKANVSEMASVPHHLMSFLPVGEEYDVGRFCHDAKRLGEGMLEQRELPLVVGGTTYYVQHLLFPGKVVTARLAEGRGGDTEPREANVATSPANEELMQRIKKLPQQEAATWEAVVSTSRNTLPGVPPLHLWQLLDKLDPDMAKRWHPQDSRKISNSLRVIADTGRPHSDWVREQEAGGNGAEEDSSTSPSPSQWAGRPLRVLLLWVWASRDDLYLRLDKRVEKMIPAGLLKEICELRGIAERMKTDEGRDETDYTRGIFQAIGYKEFKPFLDALDAAGISGVDVDLAVLSPDLKGLFDRGLQGMMTATRQYAKKQVAWMKNKLLPEVRKRRERGEEVEIILLDTTDVNKWQDNVKTPALEAVKRFLAGERLPASAHTEASRRELVPLLKEPEAKLDASAAADAGPSSLSSNAYTLCEVCTNSRENKASSPVYYRQADERHHTTSKGHRHALNRLRNKERLENEGTLADASDAALEKAERRAAKRAKASHCKATQEEMSDTGRSMPQDQPAFSSGMTTSASDGLVAGALRRRGEEEQSGDQFGGERSDLPALPPDFPQDSYQQLPASHPQKRFSPLLFLVGFHVLLACLTLTFFQPDEFWQSQEVAHRLSFGYGYLTWEWRHPGRAESWFGLLTQHDSPRKIWDYLEGGPVRSVLYPLMFVPGYLVLKATELDQNFVLLVSGRECST
jgi:tRNA A37 N6-isopentenylltransferase MiaA